MLRLAGINREESGPVGAFDTTWWLIINSVFQLFKPCGGQMTTGQPRMFRHCGHRKLVHMSRVTWAPRYCDYASDSVDMRIIGALMVKMEARMQSNHRGRQPKFWQRVEIDRKRGKEAYLSWRIYVVHWRWYCSCTTKHGPSSVSQTTVASTRMSKYEHWIGVWEIW